MNRTALPERRIRALGLTASDQRRGAEVFALDLAGWLRGKGIDLQITALSRSDDSSRLEIPTLRGRTRPSTWLVVWRAARSSDVVIGFGSSSLIFGALIARFARRPFVYRNIGDPAVWGEVAAARWRIGLPLRSAAAVAALFDDAADFLVKHYGVSDSRVRVIPSAADLDRLEENDDRRCDTGWEASLDPQLRWLGFVGALSPEKRPELAVRAISSDARLGLLVAGDGPLRKECEQLAEAIAPGRVRFLGTVDDPRKVYARIDLLLLPSRTEGIPAVAIEAAVCGVPVVAAHVGGVGEVVQPGMNGVLLDEWADAGVDEAINQFVFGDGVVDKATLTNIVRRFSLDSVGEQWASLIRSVAATEGR